MADVKNTGKYMFCITPIQRIKIGDVLYCVLKGFKAIYIAIRT